MSSQLAVADLAGRHVVLERLRSDHVGEITSAASGDRATFGWTRVPDGHDDTEAYVADLLTAAAAEQVAPFVQRRTVDHVVVGCTRFMNPRWPSGRPQPDEVEIGGTWLAASAQRSAVNTEAKLLLLTHAFEHWGVQRVELSTDARNARSRRAIERLGARFEGVLRRHRPDMSPSTGTRLRDTAVHSIIAPEWPGIRRHLEGLIGGLPTTDAHRPPGVPRP